VIADHPEVESVAVIGVSHNFFGEVVKAIIVPSNDGVSGDGITTFAAERLAEFKVPAEVEFVSELPRTSIGKVEKSSLRNRRIPDE